MKANMSPTQETAPPLPIPGPATPKAKKKKSKKKQPDRQENAAPPANGQHHPDQDADGDGDGDDSPAVHAHTPACHLRPHANCFQKSSARDDPDTRPSTATSEPQTPQRNGARDHQPQMDQDTTDRLDQLAKERDELREEVTQLRKSLETIQSKHEEDIQGLKQQADDAAKSKEHAENQYRDLRGKVNTIKSQLGERMRQDAEELERLRGQVDDLEDQNRQLRDDNEQLRNQFEEQASEVSTLRSRATLSQQNWVKERDELIQREAYAREEFETAKQAMQDWEVLAMEERSLRENLGDRVAELEDQLNSQREALERAVNERDMQTSTVDGLQRALRDIQDARKKELREIVENSQNQLEELRVQLHAAEEASKKAKTELETTQKELERALPFEKEVKEKNLLIGKLRHEAVILNDHLTKALRILRKGRPEDNVDRQIVTNHLLHFLALDRSDPKKFQVLQLIAALLGWNDEQREQAGLSRPGSTATANNTLRVPLSPFRRTPSTPSLTSTDLLLSEGHSSSSAQQNKESLAELWQNFLEQEALEGKSSRDSSRRESAASPTNTGDTKGLGIS
ncbi:golgi matrix [Neofusicoccum parvum]|uniref:Golgi matrix n=1 Tax=Neofusicoccum parvum TaxID=310453 RepID=A0ACB5SNS8_9PEZI|nr:golgi matrix [Neofusicoccum parvum]